MFFHLADNEATIAKNVYAGYHFFTKEFGIETIPGILVRRISRMVFIVEVFADNGESSRS